jgi:hypothetical protein
LFLEVFFSTIEGKRKKAYLDCLEKASWKSYLKIFLEGHTSKEETLTTFIEHMRDWEVKVAWHFVFSMLHWKKTVKGNKGVNLCKFYGYPLHLKGIILLVNYKWDKHYYLLMLV